MSKRSPKMHFQNSRAGKKYAAAYRRQFPQPQPMPDNGPIVVHECSRCAYEFATYAGRFPKGWTIVDGENVCDNCNAKQRRAR